MKKKPIWVNRSYLETTLLMTMKIFILFFSVLSFGFSVEKGFSQNEKIKFDADAKLSVEQVLEIVKKQTDINFIYRSDLFDNCPLVEVKKGKIKVGDLLKKIASVSNFEFQFSEKGASFMKKSDETKAKALKPIQKTVSGTVTGADGLPIIGANVVEKGTSKGAVTDFDGNYTIEVTNDNAILVFSYVGFLTSEIAVNGHSTINVILETDISALDEVVVVGYGTQKKTNLTGAISSIGDKEIGKVSTPNVVTGLAGRLPGMRITQRTGEPGSFSTEFDIRGLGNPLIIVDGIQRSDFNRFDPKEIDNITILKDASAAVYGVRAANGVILVTTKKGSVGSPRIEYSYDYGIQQVSNAPEVGNAYQFAVLTTENQINNGVSPNNTTYSPEDLEKFKNGTYPSTNWYDVVAKKHSIMNRHNLNISGGNEKIKYFNSVGYLFEDGLWKSGDLNYKKFNVRSSVTGEIFENLTAQLNIDGILDKKNEPGESAWNVFKFTWMNKPTLPVYANNNPDYLQDMSYPWHPLAMTTADISGYQKTTTKIFQGNATLDYKFKQIEGLSAKMMYGYYYNDVFRKQWQKKYSVYTYDELNDEYLLTGTQFNPSKLSGEYTTFQRTTFLGQLNYERLFKESHSVKAMIAFEEKHETNDNMWAQKEFSIDVDQFYAGNSANAQVNSGNVYKYVSQNVIGRLNYDYRSKYLLELGFNYGGSSKFPKGNRWGFFPYTSLGWKISEEPFIKENIEAITNLKLRMSWGQLGDDSAANFQFVTGYNYPGSPGAVFNGNYVSSLGFRGMANPNIGWYTVTTKNIGVDLDLWHGLVSLQFDLFRRDREGLLAYRNLTIPSTVGVGLPQENLNEDMRKGFELVLGHKNTIGEFGYNISSNFTFTRGRDTYIERSEDGNSYLNWRNNTTGRWNNILWGYKLLGQFQTEEEILSSPIQDGQGNRLLDPGDFKYEDINQDGIINDMDMVPIGRGNTPEINYGLNMGFTWKDFDLNILFQGAANFNRTYIEQLRGPLPWGRNSLTMFMDRWHHEDIYDANSPWIPGRYPSTGYGPSVRNFLSTFWAPDASYLRLKSVELGYTWKSPLLDKMKIQNIRFYASGFNLYTWTKIKYVDPEQDPSLYNYTYPLMKNYNFGVNVTF